MFAGLYDFVFYFFPSSVITIIIIRQSNSSKNFSMIISNLSTDADIAAAAAVTAFFPILSNCLGS